MNAALNQMCSCYWDHPNEVRLSTDSRCPVHGVDELPARQRRQLEGEVRALAEGLRDRRTEAMTALRAYRRMKRKFFEKKKQLEAL